ncbi:MAG TPA: hypothetical protein VMS64_01335 [Candidatus Methylomirabilis sp.]|nr:hypothetical protein [Candidatus Methylomirabilis sp.]
MTEHRESTPAGEDADLEREIRAGRKFSLNEAMGRMAGAGAMKGESPVTRKRQMELAIQDYLRRHITDPGGVLEVVLLRHIGEHLLRDYDQPLAALAECIQQVLGSEHLLRDLVREADAEWGRVLGERPYFEQPGRPPHPDDPYTIESVRITLSQLIDKVAAGET